MAALTGPLKLAERIAQVSVYDWLAIVGSIASIGSAIYAWVQARAAKQARTDAERARDEVRARAATVSVSQLYRAAVDAAEIARLFRGPKGPQLRGRKLDTEIARLHRFADALLEHAHVLDKVESAQVSKLATDLRTALDAITHATNEAASVHAGGEAHTHVAAAVAILRRYLDG